MHKLGPWVALAAFLAASATAAAHMGEMDPPTGSLVVPPSGAAEIPLQYTHPGDILEWVWSTTGAATSVRTEVVWTDTAGAEHRDAATPLGQRFGRFNAPRDLVSAELVFHDDGATEVPLTWTYQTSVEFWTSPDLILPAVLPFLALAGALVAGKLLDRRRKARRAGAKAVPPVHPEASRIPSRPFVVLRGGSAPAKAASRSSQGDVP